MSGRTRLDAVHTPRSLRLWAIVLAAAVGIGACGGSGTSTSSRSTATASATSAPSATSTITKTATATTATTSTQTRAVTAAAVTACITARLRLSLASAGGAAGTAYSYYDLANAGPAVCSMVGYPGVAVLDLHGRIVQHPARRSAMPQAPVRRVILRPGQHARFLVTSTDVIPSPGCPTSYSGTTLQVYPPNQRRSILLARAGPFCNLRVGAVQPTR